VHTDGGGKLAADPTEGAELLRARLEQVLATGDPRLARLAAAGTSVSFYNVDAPSASVTMLLDRQPPGLGGAEEPAEITIELTSKQVTRFARGALSLPPALVTGEAPYRGPVRKYLAVDPVLRGLLADLDAG
jgi:hypothetical protein